MESISEGGVVAGLTDSQQDVFKDFNFERDDAGGDTAGSPLATNSTTPATLNKLIANSEDALTTNKKKKEKDHHNSKDIKESKDKKIKDSKTDKKKKKDH